MAPARVNSGIGSNHHPICVPSNAATIAATSRTYFTRTHSARRLSVLRNGLTARRWKTSMQVPSGQTHPQ